MQKYGHRLSRWLQARFGPDTIPAGPVPIAPDAPAIPAVPAEMPQEPAHPAPQRVAGR